MSEIISAVSVFGWGIMFGLIIAQRKRAKSTDEQLGELVRDRVLAVAQKRRWIGGGSGFEISSNMSFSMSDGRKVELIVREADLHTLTTTTTKGDE